MNQSHPDALREVPGGARRADTFLLVIATVLAIGSSIGSRTQHPPVVALIMTGIWFQVFARWLRHTKPGYVHAADLLGAMFLGAGIYAGIAW